MGFLSRKASVKGNLEEDAVILGSSTIDNGTIIGKDVIIGYPSQKTLASIMSYGTPDLRRYDGFSQGAKIGKNCIIRSGTIIYENVVIGNNVKTGHNALIRENSVVGDETLIGSSVKLDGAVHIGNRVRIQSNAYLPSLTVIEDDVFIAPNVCFTNDPYPQSGKLIGTTVEKNAVICANATLLAGIHIGRNSVVGAGSVVTRDVSAETVVIGNPAYLYMSRKEYDEKRLKWQKGENLKKNSSEKAKLN